MDVRLYVYCGVGSILRVKYVLNSAIACAPNMHFDRPSIHGETTVHPVCCGRRSAQSCQHKCGRGKPLSSTTMCRAL